MIYPICMRQKENSKIKMAVMFGGRSAEHEISIITGLQAIQAIDPCRYEIIPVYIAQNGKWYTGESLLDKAFYKVMEDNLSRIQEVVLLPDPSARGLTILGKKKHSTIPLDACFLAFHGQYVEDGCLQGLLELADLPYTGCGVVASALAMDKYHCKMLFKAHGIPVLPAVTVHKKMAAEDLIKTQYHILNHPGLERFPLFVKPNSLGSSIGISPATDEKGLHAALAKAFRFDEIAIVEPYLSNLIEINVSVLDGDPPQASVVEIPLSYDGRTLTFEDKYLRGGSKTAGKSEGMASLTRIIDPPHLDPAIKKQVSDFALKGFSLLRCSGVVRFDFMFDKDTGNLYFNELNPIPGSLSFYLWEKSSPPLLYTELINRMVETAFKRKEEQLSLHRNLGFKAI
jgi:D-alanine-D-alanine ligase